MSPTDAPPGAAWHPAGRALLAFLLGGATVLAFAPFNLYPLALLAPALFALLWLSAAPGRAFREGYSYGLGLLGFGVFWLHISIDQFGNIGTPGAVALTLGFIALMALYYGLLAWLGSRLGGRLGRGQRLLLLYPALWVLAEWLRGWVLSGFPWLALGYSQVDSPLAGFAPLLGVYGVSWAVLLAAGCLAWLGSGGRRARMFCLGGVLLLVLMGQGLLQIPWTAPAGVPLKVAMIQANVAQQDKWRQENLVPTLTRYRELTDKLWDRHLIIWPETAIPAFAHRVRTSLLDPLAQQAIDNGSELLVGIPVWDDKKNRYYNAMMQLGSERGAYYKRHLVPFGEYIPLRRWLRPLLEWMQVPMSNFAAGEQPTPLLKVAGHWAAISICYEDAFGDEMAEALPEAAFLINASNDAWFGDSLAPPQHLQIARMRSLESGRYMIRSTNTGISALIGPRGELLDSSPAFEEHVLQGEILPMAGRTGFAIWGNGLLVIILVLVIITLRWSTGRSSASTARRGG